MKVIFGENTVEIKDNTSLVNLLEQQSLNKQQGIAVAVNNAVVPRANWNSQKLNEGDQITVIKATAGG
ncbi:MAG: sulfur carrier protein ThiS [Crocinitomicaceae bacterium]